MNFSGTTVIKIIAGGIPQELFTWTFGALIFIYVCVMSMKIVCCRGMILSQQRVIFMVPI